MTDLEEIMTEAWVLPQSYNSTSLIRCRRVLVGKAGAVGSSGKAKLREHCTLYHAHTYFLAERSILGSSERRGSGDVDDTGENAAPMYCCPFHQRYPVYLTFDPSPDPVGEWGNRGDAVPGGR